MKTILSLICLLSFVTLNAQKAGTLDKSFGDTGVYTETNFAGSCSSLLLQSDGKLATTGTMVYNNLNAFSTFRSVSAGSPDLSFGDSGKTSIQLSNRSSNGLYGVLQQDGKIVQVGDIVNNNYLLGGSLTLVRYNTDGSLDASFGNGGTVIHDLGAQGEFPSGVVIQQDGKIVVTGVLKNTFEGGGPDSIFIIRFNNAGNVDSGFGLKGVNKQESIDAISTAGIALQPDGKILFGGYYWESKSHAFFLKRFATNGKPDSSFGVNGEADFPFNAPSSILRNIALQNDGRILACGAVFFSLNKSTSVVIRFNNNGSIDNSFGVEGMVTTAVPNMNTEIDALVIQPDSKIVTAGSVHNDRGDTSQYTVTRYSSTGKLDSTFGTNGITINNVGQSAYASSIVLQNDGKIVLAGNVYNLTPPFNSVVLVRYNNDESKKQKIISEIKHYIQNHNNLQSNATADAKAASLNISLAPNPVNSMLTINGLSASTKYAVRITNENGNTVANKQVSNVSSYQINVQSLSAGVYYINIISNNNQSTTLKFIKQ